MNQKYMDLAASIQQVTEEVMLKVVAYAQYVTGKSNLCLAGGLPLIALETEGYSVKDHLRMFGFNLLQEMPAEHSESLNSSGISYLRIKRSTQIPDQQSGSLLGPAYSPEYVKEFLQQQDVAFTECANDQALSEEVAGLLESGNVVGWMQGHGIWTTCFGGSEHIRMLVVVKCRPPP